LPDVRLSTERILQIYDRIAPFYDGVTLEAQRRPKERALDLLDRKAGEAFLDVGTGTGVSLAAVVAHSGEEGAFGVDFAPGMLILARRAFEAARLAPPRLALSDALALPFASSAFHCLFSSYVLNVLPDEAIGAALGEFIRVLKPGGRVGLVNLTHGEGGDAAFTEEWTRRFERDPEGMSATRPVRALRAVRAAGFAAIRREYVGGPGCWPSEVIIATAAHIP
jgi:ubiquinone/menaquinone biosynthesis C-methylase UbiE